MTVVRVVDGILLAYLEASVYCICCVYINTCTLKRRVEVVLVVAAVFTVLCWHVL